MEYYSAIKRNEIMPLTATWMDREIIILREARERQISYSITYTWRLKKKKTQMKFFYKIEIDPQTEKTPNL